MKIEFNCTSANTRTLIRAWNKLIQLFTEKFELRLQKTKAGMRLRLDDAHVDILVDPSGGKLQFTAQFSNANNDLSGRMASLLGAFVEHVETMGLDKAHVSFNISGSELPDARAVRQWGLWALGEIKTAYPNQL